MNDLPHVISETIDSIERELGLDRRSSYSNVVSAEDGSLDVELSREEVFDAVAGRFGSRAAADRSARSGITLEISGRAVRLRFLGGNAGRLLWATASVADVRRENAHSAELLTQLIMGETARALKTQGDWHLVRLDDDYHGWIRSWHVRETDAAEIDSYTAAANAAVAANVGCVYSKPDERSIPVCDVVAGVRLAALREERGFRSVALPGGRAGFMRAADLAPPPGGPPDRSRLLARARRFLGIPYLWGGTSAKAFDCSGLVKRVFLSEGISLPRDSDQQALVGTLIPREAALDAAEGDLLFFGEGGVVSHVGVSAGGGSFIHAHGEVRMTSIAKGDDRYEERFAEIVLFGRAIIA